MAPRTICLPSVPVAPTTKMLVLGTVEDAAALGLHTDRLARKVQGQCAGTRAVPWNRCNPGAMCSTSLMPSQVTVQAEGYHFWRMHS